MRLPRFARNDKSAFFGLSTKSSILDFGSGILEGRLRISG
jgi:hypothetical protein